MATRRGTDRTRAGATTVEFAVVVSVFLLILFGIFEYGRLVMVRQIIANAAREGARFAVVHTYDKTAADVEQVVRQYLAGQDRQLKNLSVRVYHTDPATGNERGAWTDAAFGECVAVRITGDYTPLLPSLLMMNNTVPMQAVSVMHSEAN